MDSSVDHNPGNVRDILNGGDSDSSVHSSDVDEDVADEMKIIVLKVNMKIIVLKVNMD
ncbi:hypothetical protein J6590_025408 [Homalodisca vitripennis]|nr:hypothetical protein J6590_025408 [Homalodisca vitripennis]